jgi:capsid protein
MWSNEPLLVNPTPVARETKFGYEAIEDKKRRKSPTAITLHEDRLLNESSRRKLSGTTQDLRRNYAIAAWMIRRHLDYVTQFEYHARNDDDNLNDQLEELVRIQSRAANRDVTGRFTQQKMIRIAEACSVLDGDIGLSNLSSGHLQGIESDRIRTPATSAGSDEWYNGVRINRAGRPLEYAIHKRIRGGQSFQFERTIPARNFILHAKLDRFDQVRGVSPLTSSINDLVDVKENKTYALLKSKVSHLFGLVLHRDADDSPGEVTNTGAEGSERNGFEVDFGRGPFQLDLGTDETAEFLQANVPGSTFKDFHNLVLMVALKSLDLPYSFYDEGHTNFFGSRGSWMLYDRACVDKRNDVAETLRRVTIWDKVRWVLEGRLILPGKMTIADIRDEWVPTGMPWWDPAKEIRGDCMAIGAALDTPQRITKERGRGDVYENIDQIAKVQEYARLKGVKLSFDPGPEPMEIEVNNSPGSGNTAAESK